MQKIRENFKNSPRDMLDELYNSYLEIVNLDQNQKKQLSDIKDELLTYEEEYVKQLLTQNEVKGAENMSYKRKLAKLFNIKLEEIVSEGGKPTSELSYYSAQNFFQILFASEEEFNEYFEKINTQLDLNQKYGFTGNEDLENLNNYFFKAVTSLDNGEKNACLTKYLSMYDLQVANDSSEKIIDSIFHLAFETNNNNNGEQDYPSFRNAMFDNADNINNFNEVLENGIYGEDSSKTDVIMTFQHNGVLKYKYISLVNTENESNKTTASLPTSPPASYDILDLGECEKRKFLFYAMSYKFDDSYTNSSYKPHRVNNKKFTDGDFIDFGVKSKTNIYFKKFRFSNLFNLEENILAIKNNNSYYLANMNFGCEDHKYHLLDMFVFNELNFIRIVNSSLSQDLNSLLIDYHNKLKAIKNFDKHLFDFEEQADVYKSDQILQYTIRLLNQYVVILVINLRQKILVDKFMDKFNAKYLTYLFYSFNNGWKIFGDYITSVFKNENDILYLKELFFKNYEFEGLYKLMILSLKKDTYKLISEEVDQVNINNLFKADEDAMLNYDEYLNVKQYFFYEEVDYEKLAINCSKLRNKESCNNSGKCVYDDEGEFCKILAPFKSNCLERQTKDECDDSNCEFKNDKLNGFAIRYDKNGNILKEGIWKDDEFQYAQKQSSGSSNSSSKLNKYKEFCKEIGFTPGTEKFGDCVMKLLDKD